MISEEELYTIMCAMVPLYMAMIVAYGSVKWWRIFTPDQSSGINRFVTVFAVPFLSFHYISLNNPYQMDIKFILADTLSKTIVLAVLSIWGIFFNGGLDWVITLFSVATLPNTLVMGIPLVTAMFGDFTLSLMVQLIVLQNVIWEPALLLLLEYRAATLPASAITRIDLDNDVISLDGRDPFRSESETDCNGRIRTRIRRSTSESALSSSACVTPRPSNLSNAEIISVCSTPAPFHQPQNTDVIIFSGDASSDAYSLQPTPRTSNVNEFDFTILATTPRRIRSPVAGKYVSQASPVPDVRYFCCDSPRKGQNEDGHSIREKEISFRDKSQTATREDTSMNVETEIPRGIIMVRKILKVVGRKLCCSPNSNLSIIGLVWSLISFKLNVEMPSLVNDSLKIISDAALGMGMFSLGLYMGVQHGIIVCGKKRATMAMAIKFMCGPIVVYIASLAVGLRGFPLRSAILQATLPQGIAQLVLAREYGLHTDMISTGVNLGMLISLPVTLIYYIIVSLCL